MERETERGSREEQTGDRGGQRRREMCIKGGAWEEKEVNRDMDGSEQRGEASGGVVWTALCASSQRSEKLDGFARWDGLSTGAVEGDEFSHPQ